MAERSRGGFRARALNGAWLHAHLGAVVSGCLALQCGGQSEATNEERPGLGSTDTDDDSGEEQPSASETDDTPNEPNDDPGTPGGGDDDDTADDDVVDVEAGGAGGGGAAEGGGSAGGGTAEGGSSAGGGGASAGGAPNSPPGEPADVECDDAGMASLVLGLNPAEPVDEIVHYSWYADESAPTVLARAGETCEVDAGTCTAVDALPPEPGFFKGVQTYVYEYFTYRRGDEVGYLVDQDQLLAFLGTIDTPNEAALVLWGLNREAQCANLRELQDGSYWSTGDYETDLCPVTTQHFELTVARDGRVSEIAVGDPVESDVCVGRRPAGLVREPLLTSSSRLGAHFAENARLEASAVLAFASLERELRAHGAPASLIARVRAAAADEKRHAAMTAELARKFGSEVQRAVANIGPVRSLLDIAIENATEGCVRELYGAAVAQWQAHHASDAEVRRVYQNIAVDEAEHAAVSLSVATWLEARLSPGELAQVEAARHDAERTLRDELACEPDAVLIDAVGVPSSEQALHLLDALDLGTFAA
jgi:hypothetical protein